MGIQMTKKQIVVIAAIGLALAAINGTGCYYDSKEELGLLQVCDTAAVSFSLQIQPILAAECDICHSADAADLVGGGNNLDGYDNTWNFTEPGDADNSLLYQSVAWVPGASFMPKSGSQLSTCELALIRNWINQGALNN